MILEGQRAILRFGLHEVGKSSWKTREVGKFLFKKALVSFQLQRELSFSIFPNVLSNYMYKVGQINDESVPDINKLIFRQP